MFVRRDGRLTARVGRLSTFAFLVAGVVSGCNDRTVPEEVEPPSPVDVVRRDLAQGLHTCRTDGAGGVRCVCFASTCSAPDAAAYPGHPARAAVDLGMAAPVTRVVVGFSHTCTLHDNGRVKCWGRNDSGQLGLGHTADVGGDASEMGDALPYVDLGRHFVAVGLAAGPAQTCAVSDAGQVKCWGENTEGSLGLGDSDARGDEPGEMGDALPNVDLGREAKATDVSVGLRFACALLDDGRIKCWGRNGYGQLGLGESGRRGDDPSHMGDNLPHVALGTGVRAVGISTGEEHACAVLDDGRAKCWGRGAVFSSELGPDSGEHGHNDSDDYEMGGRLGLGDPMHRGRRAADMGDALPYVDLGTDAVVLGIALGKSHSCALLEHGKLKCWGANQVGQLGLEDRTDRGDQPGEMGDALMHLDLGTNRRVVAVSALSSFGSRTCVLLDDDSVKCWGGTRDDPGGELGTMGDALVPIDL